MGDDITRLENLILPFLHLKPSAEVQQQITYAYGEVNRVEQSGGLILTSASVVAYNDHGAEFTANQLSDIKLLLPYHEGKQNVFFQFVRDGHAVPDDVDRARFQSNDFRIPIHFLKFYRIAEI